MKMKRKHFYTSARSAKLRYSSRKHFSIQLDAMLKGWMDAATSGYDGVIRANNVKTGQNRCETTVLKALDSRQGRIRSSREEKQMRWALSLPQFSVWRQFPDWECWGGESKQCLGASSRHRPAFKAAEAAGSSKAEFQKGGSYTEQNSIRLPLSLTLTTKPCIHRVKPQKTGKSMARKL